MTQQVEAGGNAPANGQPAVAVGDEEETPLEKMGSALARTGGLPEWFVSPPGFRAPPGRRVTIMRFRPHWTFLPEKGERQVVCWPLTESEEQLASQRARGDDRKMVHELAKQTVRYIDGVRADWTMTPGSGANVQELWNELGPACTKLIVHYYVKAHTLIEEDQLDFFANCFASTISVPV